MGAFYDTINKNNRELASIKQQLLEEKQEKKREQQEKKEKAREKEQAKEINNVLNDFIFQKFVDFGDKKYMDLINPYTRKLFFEEFDAYYYYNFRHKLTTNEKEFIFSDFDAKINKIYAKWKKQDNIIKKIKAQEQEQEHEQDTAWKHEEILNRATTIFLLCLIFSPIIALLLLFVSLLNATI